MSLYIAEIQRQFVDVYKFQAQKDAPKIPQRIPDGEYPMWIDKKIDNVRVVDGKILCCNFAPRELKK